MIGSRGAGLVAVVLLVPALLGSSALPSLARFADAASSTVSLTTDTLDPPTTLAATGGTSASLTWNATPDTYASGYELQRATVSGGPYTLVSSVTPRTTVATTDAPGASGTYYYVLQSVFQNWRSVNSNQASATITLAPTATGYHGCTGTSNAADTGGDGNGYQTAPQNGCAPDGNDAQDSNSGTNTTVSCTNTGKDRHRYWTFGLGVPVTVSAVTGIQVRADMGLNNITGTTNLCAELSWNGGTTWTTPKSVALTAVATTTYGLGSASDTWGRTWVGSDFSDAAFRVRLTNVSSFATKNFKLDYLAVQVTYTP